MDRLINVKVSGSHLWKDSKLAGTQHEGNVNRLRITFDEGWDGFAKKVVFWDAKGQNPVERTLTVDLLENIRNSTLIYLCPIPGEPMAEAGMMTFVIEGYLEGKRARSVGAELEVEASPYVDEAGQPVDPTPTQAEQIQGQIDTIISDMQEQATLAIDAANKAYERKEEAEYARDLAEHSARAAATSENDAAASAASAADSANAASECFDGANEAMVSAKQYAWDADFAKGQAERFAAYAEQHVAEAEEKKQEAAASADRADDIKNEIANVLHESEAHRDRAEAAAQRAAGSEAAAASSAAAAKDAANVASECYADASEAMLDAQQAARDAGYARDQAKTYAESSSGSVEKAAASATAAGHSQVLAESAADGAEELFEMTKSHAELAKREASDAATWANIAKQSAEGADAIKEAAEAAKNDAEKAKLSIQNMKITGETVEHDSTYSAVEKYTEADGTVHLHLNLRQGNPGVYVGDGAFPSGYSVQVSPNGDGMDIPEMVENAVRTGLQEAKDSGEFDGPKGNPGDDGISPTVNVTEIDGGHQISITDKNGTQTFDVRDGEGGTGGLLGDDLAEGDDLNAEKFYNFEGKMKVFSWPTAGTSGGTLKNAPAGISASYDLYLICARESADVCTQMLFANIRKGTSTLSLNSKDIWMRNREKSKWTEWKKVFPGSGLEGLELNTGDDLNKLDMSGSEEIRVFNGSATAPVLTNAPPGKGGADYSPTVINIRTGLFGSSVLQYWIAPSDINSLYSAAEVWARTISVSGTALTEWQQVFPVSGDSWYDLEDRPFGEETQVENIISKTISVPSSGMFAGMYTESGLWSLEIGKTYTVVYDGVSYECECYASAFQGMDVVGLGNNSLYGGSNNTGEPFAIGVISAMGMSGVFGTPGDHTVAINEKTTVIHKLDNKFLDLTWLPIAKVEKTVVASVETTTETSGSFEKADWMQQAIANGTLTVEFNGTLYDCKMAQYNMFGIPAYAFGNADITALSGAVNTGEPFVVLIMTADNEISGNWSVDYENGYTLESLSIVTVSTVYNKMPEEFLPKDVGGGGKAVFDFGEDNFYAIYAAMSQGNTTAVLPSFVDLANNIETAIKADKPIYLKVSSATIPIGYEYTSGSNYFTIQFTALLANDGALTVVYVLVGFSHDGETYTSGTAYFKVVA